MKSEKGISLVSLIIYLIVMTIVVTIIARISTYFYKNVSSTDSNLEQNEQLVKFNAFITKEINIQDNIVNDIGDNGKYIIFNKTQNQYTFENGAIYINKVKICSKINTNDSRFDINGDVVIVYLTMENGTRFTNCYKIN